MSGITFFIMFFVPHCVRLQREPAVAVHCVAGDVTGRGV